MANFFDLKARQAAGTNGSSSKTAPGASESTRLQPWVEK
jgi:hypothetical protein